MQKNYSAYKHPFRMNQYLAPAIALLAISGVSCAENRYPDALEPEEALRSFQLDSAFTIELFASEPMIMDPVEMVFDRRGRAYVVEMEDYPFKPEPGKAKGRIRLLEDTDGDGKADKATLFADSLSEATSVLPWKDGLIVTTAPYILHLKDTTGDNRADTREVLFSGFFQNNSEAQITNLHFNVDNWIYASNHGQPGEVQFARKPDAPAVSVQGADFRFRLDREAFEPETGAAQFGQAINDWGHRFMTQNTIHIQQAVIPWRYLHRHAYLPSDRASTDISDHGLRMFQQTPAPYWRAERTRRRQKEYKERGLDRQEYAEDHFTGASGGTIYSGNIFPDAFYGNIFTGDVAGNLVHRDVLTPLEDSPVYQASRSGKEGEREFLSSADPWFRPVNFTVGPEGALYIIDMYRQHIETPLSIPEDLKKDMDFMNGSDRGRIYRIVPKSGPGQEQQAWGAEWPPRPEGPGTDALVKLLAHPNRWWRLQAQQLLLELQDRSAVPALQQLFHEHTDPRARLHALYTLEGLSALDAEIVKAALADSHPGLREHGLILAERFPECLPGIKERTADPSPRVALQACLSLGEFPAAEAAPALSAAAARYSEDRWFRMAILSSDAGSSSALLGLLDRDKVFFAEAKPGKIRFLEDLSFIMAARGGEGEIGRLLDVLSGLNAVEEWQLAGLRGLEKGLKKNQHAAASVAGAQKQLTAMKENAKPESAEILDRILSMPVMAGQETK
ncbi:PVC-type heme-binding CxxCH protein [Anseongella ginsenosidimutans]|nr:PVC-type heme-binding CxxCH protein [Anseongella ginsenosidimutans]